MTTVVLAKRSTTENRPHVISGATLMASGIMYLRISALLGLFNRELMAALVPSFAALSGAAVLAGWLWSRRPDRNSHTLKSEFEPPNPLELRAALLFAALFLTMLIATHAAAEYLGKLGVSQLCASGRLCRAGVNSSVLAFPLIAADLGAAAFLHRLRVLNVETSCRRFPCRQHDV